MSQKPSIPKGTRDFSPEEINRRNYIFDTIKGTFKRFGYLPIETPAMENLSTLMGKYGEEGDKLLFKILNSGNFLSDIDDNDLTNRDIGKITNKISGKGLKFDLTVPFARYVVQHRNDITLPFKRYQIQPVWRADNPQKGRYREFYQCDVDVIGSDSMLNEAELIQIIDVIFDQLKINITVKVNNRKILSGIAELIGEAEKFADITVAIDKLEKIGAENVNKELLSKGLCQDAIDKLQPIIYLKGTINEKLTRLENMFEGSETGLKGISEINAIFAYLEDLNINSEVNFDLTLARGLNYYTGAIIEVISKEVTIGSICGGGRYDDLTGIFGLEGVSGVGVSFGADRIYDVMKTKDLFPKDIESNTKILFLNFGNQEEKYCLPLLTKIRNEGINAEMYPDPVKIKKQMNYANKKKIPFVGIVGKDEMEKEKINLKNMETGNQELITITKLIEQIM